MANLNETLIREVFDEMVKFKPSLTKFTFIDEDDDDEDDEMDYRVLGDLVLKNFPWPIGVELRRLFSGSMRQLDRLRLDQLFKTIERVSQFISFGSRFSLKLEYSCSAYSNSSKYSNDRWKIFGRRSLPS